MADNSRALDLLVEGIFDYAGMFPPASLDLAEALRTAAAFPNTLLRPGLVASQAVIPYSRIPDITTSALSEMGFPQGSIFSFVVLSSSLGSNTEAVSAECSSLRHFQEERAAEAIIRQISAVEMKLEAELLKDSSALAAALNSTASHMNDMGIVGFIEADLSTDCWQRDLEGVTNAIEQTNAEFESPRLGLKIRGTGPTAIGNDRIAHLVNEVCEKELPFKATAGLHHPIIETDRYGNTLGFINLSVALYLRRAAPEISISEIKECLASESEKDFLFTDEELSWRNHKLATSRLKELKQAYHFSIGSCSIHEPDEDLSRLFR